MSRLLASMALGRNHLLPLLITMRDKRRYQNVLLAVRGLTQLYSVAYFSYIRQMLGTC
jgi:hypothetical protein